MGDGRDDRAAQPVQMLGVRMYHLSFSCPVCLTNHRVTADDPSHFHDAIGGRIQKCAEDQKEPRGGPATLA